MGEGSDLVVGGAEPVFKVVEHTVLTTRHFIIDSTYKQASYSVLAHPTSTKSRPRGVHDDQGEG